MQAPLCTRSPRMIARELFEILCWEERREYECWSVAFWKAHRYGGGRRDAAKKVHAALRGIIVTKTVREAINTIGVQWAWTYHYTQTCGETRVSLNLQCFVDLYLKMHSDSVRERSCRTAHSLWCALQVVSQPTKSSQYVRCACKMVECVFVCSALCDISSQSDFKATMQGFRLSRCQNNARHITSCSSRFLQRLLLM